MKTNLYGKSALILILGLGCINRQLLGFVTKNVPEVQHFRQEVLESKVPVFVKFHALWCTICSQMVPIDVKMVEKFAGRVKILQVNVDVHKPLLRRYRIVGVPTYVAFIKGKQVGRQRAGFLPEREYELLLQELAKQGGV